MLKVQKYLELNVWWIKSTLKQYIKTYLSEIGENARPPALWSKHDINLPVLRH